MKYVAKTIRYVLESRYRAGGLGLVDGNEERKRDSFPMMNLSAFSLLPIFFFR
jgi:hypothetical protein